MLLLLNGVGCCSLCLLFVKSLSSVLGVCGDVVVSNDTGSLICMGLKLFLSGTCWFHLCILLCSCWLGIFSDRLCQFSEQLELDLLDT